VLMASLSCRISPRTSTVIGQLAVFSSEVTRVAREVGTEGKLGGQAQVKAVSGVWKELTDSVNQMAGNLTAQVRNIAEVEDEAGNDEKILAVPIDAVHSLYSDVNSYQDLPTILREQIGHFFRHYKDLEPGKWVKLSRWGDAPEAAHIIMAAIERKRGGLGEESTT
jgi:Inorganic pyrophosphatase